MTTERTTADNVIDLGLRIATGAFMVASIVAAKVGHSFYTISQLPTAAQFGAKCLTTLVEGGALIGGSVGIALATDLIFGALVNKIIENRKLTGNKNAEMAGYAFKRSITIVSVIGFALIMGASPIVPIVGLVALIVSDILGLAKDTAVKAYQANKLLKEQQLVREQNAANTLKDLSNQIWNAYDLPDTEENSKNLKNLAERVIEAKKLSKETKTILDDKLANGNEEEKMKAELLIKFITPPKEEEPKVENAINIDKITENFQKDMKEVEKEVNNTFNEYEEILKTPVDLSKYDTTPLDEQNFNKDSIDAKYCRENLGTLIITHDKDGTKLDKEIVLNLKNN